MTLSKNHPISLIMTALLILLLAYAILAPGLSPAIHPVVLGITILISLTMLVGLGLRRGRQPHWRIQLMVLGALAVLTGISYHFSFQAGQQAQLLRISVLVLGLFTLVGLMLVRLNSFRLSQQVKVMCGLSGLGLLLVGSFWVFPQVTLQPLFVMVWCMLTLGLFSISLVGVFQDMHQASSQRTLEPRLTVGLASATVFTLVAMLPVLVVSVGLFQRFLTPL